VRVPGGRTVTLRVRESRGSKLVRATTSTATGTGAWQQLTVQGEPVAGGTSISVDVIVSLTSSLRAQIDDVGLRKL
jgi:hypothetical protein